MTSLAGGAVVRRPRLHTRLASAACSVLVAPSGFGKSTLLRDWGLEREALGDDIVWVPMTEAPSSAREFWRLVLRSAAARGVVRRLDEALVDLGAGAEPDGVLARAFAVRGRVWLFVDGFEHALGLGVGEGLLRLAATHALQLVVAGRSAPELTDPVARARYDVDVIGPAELALTLPEVTELLDRSGIGAGVAAELHRDTGGYPLAVRVYCLGERSVLTSGLDSDAHVRVAGVLLSLVAPVQREFMLATAPPPFFDADLARTLAGDVDITGLLHAIERDGLGRWIPYGPTDRVFQYADAVRAVLLGAATQDAARFDDACAHVAAWLLESGDFESALRAALAAGRYDLASVAVGRLLATNPVAYTSAMLAPRLRSVDASELARYPLLAFGHALALLTNVATRTAATPFLQISAGADATDPGLETGPHAAGVVRVGSLRVLGRFMQAAHEAWTCVAAMRADPVLRDPHAREGRALAYRQFSYTLLQAGEIDRAREVGRLAVVEAEHPWSVNQSLSWAAGVDAVDGRRLDADTLLREIDVAAWPPGHADLYVNGPGRVAAAFSALDDFKHTQAMSEYDSCAFTATSEFWPLISMTRLAASLGLGHGLLEARRIHEQMGHPDLPPGVGDSLGTAMLRGTLAVAWLAAGRTALATAELEQAGRHRAQIAPAQLLAWLVGGEAARVVRALDSVEELRGHTVRSRAATATIGAAAALRLGRTTLAHDLVEGAALLFRLYGARAHLAVLPSRDLRAMRAAFADDSAVIGYLECPTDGIDYPERVVLTEREVEVMTALLRLRTREEVAAALHVSVNTVKVHMKTAYKKLGASSREEALERFRELGR